MTWQKKHHWSTNCSALSQTFRACSKRVFAALQIECSAMFLSGNNLSVCPIYQYLLRVQISMSRIEKSSRFVAKSVYIHILRQCTKGAKKYFKIEYHFKINQTVHNFFGQIRGLNNLSELSSNYALTESVCSELALEYLSEIQSMFHCAKI